MCFNRKDKMKISKASFPILVVALGAMLQLVACQRPKERILSRGFYYWKTNVNISPYEQDYMHRVGAQVTYLRFFDIDIAADGRSAGPLAVVNFGKGLPDHGIVPVVFITARALDVMQWHELDDYAENIAQLLARRSSRIDLVPIEIQIDCDWTRSNRDLYFELLKRLRQQEFFRGKKLSATIRSHQVRSPLAAGIPPVDRGLLMVYNIDKLTDINVENSILNDRTAKKYLAKVGDYPIPLDIALPIFSWTLLFERETLKGILRDLKEEDLQNRSIFEPMKANRYLVQKDTLYKGYELSQGQVLRHEASEIEHILGMARYLSDRIRSDSLTLLLYHCDSINFSKYSTNEMEEIFSSFGQRSGSGIIRTGHPGLRRL